MSKVAALASLIFLFLSFTALSANKEIHLAYGEYPPYYGKALDNNGPISEIIVEAYKRVGYRVKLHFISSWARRMKETREGNYDGIYSGWFREERKQWFVFSDPLPANELGFYKRKKDNITFNKLDDLKPYSIGVILGYKNAEKFERAQLKTEAVEKESQNIGKLLLNRIDLALIDKGVGRHILNTKYADQSHLIEWMSPPIEVANQHLMISKKTDEFQKKIDDFNIGLNILKERNLVEKIMIKHGFK